MVRALGIDVQVRRRCPWVLRDGESVRGGWLPAEGAPVALRELVAELSLEGRVAVGIDAPRAPLHEARTHAFRGGAWRPMTGRGFGRHCEVVVRSLGLGNPQWTRPAAEAPPWMELGFALFRAAQAGGAERVFEVFPSAAYRSLAGRDPEPLLVPPDVVEPGPKDVLDAAMAAYTVRRVMLGEGAELGGGDGLGTIALPRTLTAEERASAVHDWPGAGA